MTLTRFYLEQLNEKGDRLKVRSIPDWMATSLDQAKTIGAIAFPVLLSGNCAKVVLWDAVTGLCEELK